MYSRETFFEHIRKSFAFPVYHTDIILIRQAKKKAAAYCRRTKLLFTERLAVGALILGGICLMGTHQNAIQGAVVLAVAMVCAGLYGAFDGLVSMAVHCAFLLLFGMALVWAAKEFSFREYL